MILSTENMIVRRRVGDFAAVDMFREAGFTGIDYSLCSMYDWKETVYVPGAPEYADSLREYAGSRGMVFSQSHAPYDFRYGMKMDESSPEYRAIVRSMEFAAHLGSPMIVVHSVRIPGDDVEEAFRYNLEYYRSFLCYAERFGIRIAVENLGGKAPGSNEYSFMCLGSPELFCRMQDELASPWICGCLDIGHALLTTGDPAGFIRKCKGHVDYLHVHDNDGVNDLHQIPALNGKSQGNFRMPWDDVLSALREIGYSGPFDLEVFRFIDNFRTEELPLVMRLAAEVGKAMTAKLD